MFCYFLLRCIGHLMAERFYNVKRVAQIITGSTDDSVIDQTIRKIRHWTNSDILSPIGDKNTGTGVSRLYDENAVYTAALLLETTRYGVTVEMIDTFEDWIKECWEDDDLWEEAKREDSELVFQLGWHEDGSGFYRQVSEENPLFWKPRGAGDDYFYTSSIVINATNVFRKMSW